MSLDFMLYVDVDTGSDEMQKHYVCDENITHNLTAMAKKASIYDCLWRPDENGFKSASDIIKPLEKGLKELKAKPQHFKQFNSPNGWGMYEHFVPFVERILDAANKHPKALIKVYR